MGKIEKIFKGQFIQDPKTLREKLTRIQAYLFDWDGVFNDGHKNDSGSSTFSEVDSMGTNLLRFNHYLSVDQNPLTAIISGEQNKSASYFAEREHFHAVYTTRNKNEALLHFLKWNQLQPEQVAFFFDDVLDLSIAAQCGLRIMVRHEGSPMTLRYAIKNKLADYYSYAQGGNHAVREGTELLMSLSAGFELSLEHRIRYSPEYRTYLEQRNSVTLQFFSEKDLLP